jgi:hypothetical protein
MEQDLDDRAVLLPRQARATSVPWDNCAEFRQVERWAAEYSLSQSAVLSLQVLVFAEGDAYRRRLANLTCHFPADIIELERKGVLTKLSHWQAGGER